MLILHVFFFIKFFLSLLIPVFVLVAMVIRNI